MLNSNQPVMSLGLSGASLRENKKVRVTASMTHRTQFDCGLILDHNFRS